MPLISEGKIQFLEEDKEEVMAYTRTTDNQKLAVFCNLKEEESEVEWEEEKAEKLIGNYPDEDDLDVQNGKLKLRAKQKRQRVLCIPHQAVSQCRRKCAANAHMILEKAADARKESRPAPRSIRQLSLIHI